jgi:hypothetical protein
MLSFLGASAVLATQIAASVGRNRLVYSEKAETGDPPQVALGIAMGAFRGMFVNWLWIRANDLKEEGKYFEAVDLAKTITRLQPRFPKVWQFHAWNLAYNISVATQTPEERWNWVQAGIRLLRNEGIPANPSSIDLHRELAWIHLHKIQGYMDDAHRHYKRELAREWSVVMGSPPKINFEDMYQGNIVKQQYIDRWLKPIAAAPDTLDELYAKDPAARELVDRLTQAGLKFDRRFLYKVETIESVLSAQSATGITANLSSDPVVALMLENRFANAGKMFINHLRKRLLVDEYHMEPERMIRYTEKYGPLDWRHPAAHSVYWSARGAEEALLKVNAENKKDSDVLNTDRLTIQSVQELFRTGLITFDVLNPEFYLALPNTDYIDTYRNVLKELEARSAFDKKDRVYRFYWAGYENFMRDAIRYLWRRGDRDAARKYQQLLYTDPDLNVNNPWLYQELSKPTEIFVADEIIKDNRETNPTVALQEITGALWSAYINGLLRGDGRAFDGEYDYARLFHAKFQESQAFQTWVSGPEGRMGFPPFEQYAGMVLAQLISHVSAPQGPMIYRRAPPQLQGRAYAVLERSELRQILDEQSKTNGGPAFSAWFPEPAGIDMFRLEMFPDDPMPKKGRIELK